MKTLSSILKHEMFPLIVIALTKLIVHLFAITSYDYFRDEFYYIACSKHMDFGYVDHPPFAEAILFIVRNMLGESLFSIRIIPILVSCYLVILTGLLVKEFGGKKYAQLLAGISVGIAPVLLGTAAAFSMNVFDQLFWTQAIYFIIRFINTEQNKYLLLTGIAFGVGLQTKHLISLLLIGMFIGIVLTQHRKHLRNKWLWISLATAFLLFLPNLIWQFKNGFPNIEFARNAALYKNTETKPLEFFIAQVMDANPASIFLFLFALVFLLIVKEGRRYRFLGIAYIFVLAALLSLNGKSYYAAPLIPLVFAAGATYFSKVTQHNYWRWFKPVGIIAIVISGMFGIPFALPILPPESFIAYSLASGITSPQNERHEMGPLPQHYADMFGWRELAANVAKVYATLPDSEKTDCAIYTTNYGRAGAIDFFGKQYGLPKSICGHNNYWYWGPGNSSGKTIIIVGGRMEEHIDDFESVTEVGVSDHPYAMPFERHVSIFIARKLKVPILQAWKGNRSFI
jgi:hypothetical protein